MSRKRTLSLSLGAGSALLLAALAFCCGERGREPEHTEPAPASGAEAVAPSAPPVIAAPTTESTDAGAPPSPSPAAAAEPADNPVAHSMAKHDARDRALLAELERTTRRAPPVAVHELIALRRQGKSDAELEQFITEHFAGDLAVRAAALRWLHGRDEPADGSATGDAPTGPLGEGGNPRRVQPLKPSKRE